MTMLSLSKKNRYRIAVEKWTIDIASLWKLTIAEVLCVHIKRKQCFPSNIKGFFLIICISFCQSFQFGLQQEKQQHRRWTTNITHVHQTLFTALFAPIPANFPWLFLLLPHFLFNFSDLFFSWSWCYLAPKSPSSAFQHSSPLESRLDQIEEDGKVIVHSPSSSIWSGPISTSFSLPPFAPSLCYAILLWLSFLI